MKSLGSSLRLAGNLRGAATGLVMVGALIAVGEAQVPTGELESRARAAKAAGQNSVTVSVIIDFDQARNLNDLLRHYSALLVTPRKIEAAQSVGPSMIQTWHTFEIQEVLSSRSADQAFCSGPAPRLSLGSSEIAVPFPGGSKVIESVKVTVDSGWRKPESNRRYLVFGVRCDNGVFVLPHGRTDLFTVDDTGALIPTGTPSSRPVQELVESAPSVRAIKTRLAGLQWSDA